MKQKPNLYEAKYLTSDTKTDPYEAKNQTLQKNEEVYAKTTIFHHFYSIIVTVPNPMKQKTESYKANHIVKNKKQN